MRVRVRVRVRGRRRVRVRVWVRVRVRVRVRVSAGRPPCGWGCTAAARGCASAAAAARRARARTPAARGSAAQRRHGRRRARRAAARRTARAAARSGNWRLGSKPRSTRVQPPLLTRVQPPLLTRVLPPRRAWPLSRRRPPPVEPPSRDPTGAGGISSVASPRRLPAHQSQRPEQTMVHCRPWRCLGPSVLALGLRAGLWVTRCLGHSAQAREHRRCHRRRLSQRSQADRPLKCQPLCRPSPPWFGEGISSGEGLQAKKKNITKKEVGEQRGQAGPRHLSL